MSMADLPLSGVSVYHDPHVRKHIEAELKLNEDNESAGGGGMIKVIAPFSWRAQDIGTAIRKDLPDLDEHTLDIVSSVFFEKIREASWRHGIDWNVRDGVVSLAIPNRISEYSVSVTTRTGKSSNLTGLAALLYSVLTEVDPKQVHTEISALSDHPAY